MCYSFRTSIISYTLGIIAGICALSTRQYILGCLILAYCQIQLSEAVIWKGIDDNNLNMNRIGTAMAKYTLPSHLIAVGIGYLLVVDLLHKKRISPVDYIPLFIGILFYIVVVFIIYPHKTTRDTTFPQNPNCTSRDCQNRDNRLNWTFPQEWYLLLFAIFILFILVYVKPVNSKIIMIGGFILTFILSRSFFPKSSSSMWCFLAAITAPLIVLANYTVIKNIPSKNLIT